jgi:hypothetical protein
MRRATGLPEFHVPAISGINLEFRIAASSFNATETKLATRETSAES